MAKAIKKVDYKKVAKMEVAKEVREMLEGLGLTVKDGPAYGMTESTLVVSMAKVDVQIKLITPKSGVDRYAELEEEKESDEPIVEEPGEESAE